MFVDFAEKKWENCVRGFMKKKKNKKKRNDKPLIMAAIVSTRICTYGCFLRSWMWQNLNWNDEKTFRDRGSGFVVCL